VVRAVRRDRPPDRAEDVLLERLRTRTTNPFGKTEEERARILRDVAEVEPLLRASSTHVVDTTAPPDRVIDVLEGIATEAAARHRR
jgi:hypothetical protein